MMVSQTVVDLASILLAARSCRRLILPSYRYRLAWVIEGKIRDILEVLSVLGY
jgi:hypothetical protein